MVDETKANKELTPNIYLQTKIQKAQVLLQVKGWNKGKQATPSI